MDLFLILSILVSAKEKLNIWILATSSSACCLILSFTVSKLNNITALTTVFYTFAFCLAEALLTHIIPDSFLHLSQVFFFFFLVFAFTRHMYFINKLQGKHISYSDWLQKIEADYDVPVGTFKLYVIHHCGSSLDIHAIKSYLTFIWHDSVSLSFFQTESYMPSLTLSAHSLIPDRSMIIYFPRTQFSKIKRRKSVSDI